MLKHLLYHFTISNLTNQSKGDRFEGIDNLNKRTRRAVPVSNRCQHCRKSFGHWFRCRREPLRQSFWKPKGRKQVCCKFS